jgi:hypothetical protein
MSCGRRIDWDAPSCPYCYWTPGARTAQEIVAEPISSRKRMLLYAGSLLIPLFGIVLGLLYVFKDDKEHEHVGMVCLVLGLIASIVLPVLMAAVLYLAVLGM